MDTRAGFGVTLPAVESMSMMQGGIQARILGTYINVLCYSKKACLPAAEPKTVYQGAKHVE